MNQKKIDQSLRLIDSVANRMGNLILGFSGGKDSVVIYDLVKRVMGDDIDVAYANTTIDPPGTKKFIIDNFSDVRIVNPKESFFELVKRKGLPTRKARYCCEYLKEYLGVGKNMFEGVRSSESREREGRDYIQCDSRPSYQGGQHIYPIYDWSDQDVWSYTHQQDLPINPNYTEVGGCMTRIGCVGCPLAGKKQRAIEFAAFPKYLEATKKAIQTGMSNNPQWKLTQLAECDGDKAIAWWLSRRTMNDHWDLTIEERLMWQKRARNEILVSQTHTKNQ